MYSKAIFHFCICLLAFLAILFSCRTPIKSQQNSIPEIIFVQRKPILIPLDSSHPCYTGIKKKEVAIRFYEGRHGKPVWLREDGGFNLLADSLTMFIKGIRYYGLNPEVYLADSVKIAHQSHEDLLATEVRLTEAFLTISSNLKSGRYSLRDDTTDSVGTALLQKVIHGEGLAASLQSQEPSFSGYRSLKVALANMLDSMEFYNQVDSVQIVRKIQTIQFNLDRWRQEERPFANRYVYINIPSFMLQIVEDDTVIFSSKVIVGAIETPTPEITSIIECFTIYPYWHVPRKIAVEEYLPIIQRDTTFISRNNFDVLDRKGKILNADSIDWTKLHKNYFPVVLRQREGEENSLGIVKFLFDNPHAVYVHDTNAKRLFRSSRRAFSHGCIRMEKAVEMAHYLVTGQINAKSRIVEKYFKEKQRRTIDLKTPIPIYVRYFTAEGVGGKLFQYEDIYNKQPIDNERLTGL